MLIFHSTELHLLYYSNRQQRNRKRKICNVRFIRPFRGDYWKTWRSATVWSSRTVLHTKRPVWRMAGKWNLPPSSSLYTHCESNKWLKFRKLINFSTDWLDVQLAWDSYDAGYGQRYRIVDRREDEKSFGSLRLQRTTKEIDIDAAASETWTFARFNDQIENRWTVNENVARRRLPQQALTQRNNHYNDKIICKS